MQWLYYLSLTPIRSSGLFGISLAASGGFVSEKQDNKSTGKFTETKEYTACYNVSLFALR